MELPISMSNIIYGYFTVIMWAISIPMVPWTFLRKREQFPAAVGVFLYLLIGVMCATGPVRGGPGPIGWFG
jgi:hypothetical protein